MSNSQHGMTTIPSKSNASPKVLPHGLSVPIAAKNGSARRHDSYLNPTTPRSSADVVLAKKHSDSDSDTEKNNQSDSNSALGTDEERMTQEDSQSRQVNSKARSICSGWTDRSAACISATASLPRDRNTVISQSPRNNSVQKLGKTKVNGESKNSILSEGTSNNGDPTLSTSQSQTPPSIREIVIGRELPPPTLNRHFSIDGSIASSVGNLSAGSYNMWKQRGCSESNHPPTFNNTIRAGDLVPNPHPNDVLFPLTGMLLWPGNEYFVAKVDEFRDNFLTCGTRSEQARIALVLIQQVMLGVNRHDQPPARFLSKVKTANAVPGTLCSWVVMDETSVLVQLGRAFRIRVAKEQRMTKDKLKKKKSESGEKALKKAKRNQIQSHVQIERNEDEDSSEETHDPLKGLKTLYHIPQDGYRMSELMQNATRYSPHEARVDKALSPPLQYSSNLPTSDGESLQSTESASTSHSSVYMDDSKQPFPLIDHALPEKRQKRKYKKRKSLSSSDADVAETPKLKSKEAAFVNEGEVVLPKGVTVRPSGKWQAQIYFAGQSRYVGVYSTSRLAAHAYRVVQSQLKIHRRFMHQKGRDYSDCSKDEVAAVFTAARHDADVSVNELERIIASGNYSPKKTEQKLLSNLESQTAMK